ncbi:MAG: hypothetical protein IPG96_21590 [Proteobacteria bacterium]|nr:hypothetical protein [Pseudomonadota bacterium]
MKVGAGGVGVRVGGGAPADGVVVFSSAAQPPPALSASRPIRCVGNTDLTVSDRLVRGAGDGVFAGGNCTLTLRRAWIDVAGTGLVVADNATVKLEDSFVRGRRAAVRARDNATVSGTGRLVGDVASADNATVEVRPAVAAPGRSLAAPARGSAAPSCNLSCNLTRQRRARACAWAPSPAGARRSTRVAEPLVRASRCAPRAPASRSVVASRAGSASTRVARRWTCLAPTSSSDE